VLYTDKMAVYREVYMEHTNFVVKKQRFLVLKLTVHIITTGLLLVEKGPAAEATEAPQP
jgi:hypothetical protein